MRPGTILTLFAVSVLLGAPARAASPDDDCAARTTHVETAACLTGRAALEQQALGDAVKLVKERIAGIGEEPRRVQASAALDQAQQSWSAWRDAQCGMEQELDPANAQSGNARRLICEIDLTRQRAEALNGLAARIAPGPPPALPEAGPMPE